MTTRRFGQGLVNLVLTALVLFQGVAAFAWGNEGHTYVNRVAAEKVPASPLSAVLSEMGIFRKSWNHYTFSNDSSNQTSTCSPANRKRLPGGSPKNLTTTGSL